MKIFWDRRYKFHMWSGISLFSQDSCFFPLYTIRAARLYKKCSFFSVRVLLPLRQSNSDTLWVKYNIRGGIRTSWISYFMSEVYYWNNPTQIRYMQKYIMITYKWGALYCCERVRPTHSSGIGLHVNEWCTSGIKQKLKRTHSFLTCLLSAIR